MFVILSKETDQIFTTHGCMKKFWASRGHAEAALARAVRINPRIRDYDYRIVYWQEYKQLPTCSYDAEFMKYFSELLTANDKPLTA